jgi:hypothetical protein
MDSRICSEGPRESRPIVASQIGQVVQQRLCCRNRVDLAKGGKDRTRFTHLGRCQTDSTLQGCEITLNLREAWWAGTSPVRPLIGPISRSFSV